MQQSQTSTVAIATKILVQLVLLASCSPPGVAFPEVCVLAPHLERPNAVSPGIPLAQLPLSRPTLFIREPLVELRIEQGETLLWSWQALKVGAPLEGPLAWPLAAVKPRQTVTVRLRPFVATPEEFATIQLEGAPPQRMRDGDGLLHSLMGHPAAWRPAIEGLLAKGDHPLAMALLFASEGPNDPELHALRLLVAQQSCQ